MTLFVNALAQILDLGSVFEPITHAFKSLKNTISTHQKVNTTIKELNKLSDRELADIGISRGMIRSVAMETNDGVSRW